MSHHAALRANLVRHDYFIAAVNAACAILLPLSWPISAAYWAAGTVVLVSVLAAWRWGGALSTRLFLAALNALTVLAVEVLPSGGRLDPTLVSALMPVTLCLLLPYRDWRPVAAAVGAFTLASALSGHSDIGLAVVVVLALVVGYLALGMQREAAERFELEFLVNAMGRDGPIRLNFDAVRAESPVGQRLKHIQSRMADALRLVRGATTKVQGVAVELGDSATELRERTEQTARGLQDAAMSLEQINVIVQDSAKAAAEARNLSSNAAEQAQRGGVVVGQMVQTMRDIDASSRRITDIIGTIDSIAFRTNILALNAAVEAARAGDAGRGFAVVATEVRMLAGRAAEAAKEIRELVAASLATVERGGREAGEAGRAINELVHAVQGVGKAFENLTADSAEHAASIDVVTASVKELDTVTARNLGVAVRGSQIASDLLVQSVQLAEVLTSFRLGDDQQVDDLLAAARLAAQHAEQAASVATVARRNTANDGGGVDFF